MAAQHSRLAPAERGGEHARYASTLQAKRSVIVVRMTHLSQRSQDRHRVETDQRHGAAFDLVTRNGLAACRTQGPSRVVQE